MFISNSRYIFKKIRFRFKFRTKIILGASLTSPSLRLFFGILFYFNCTFSKVFLSKICVTLRDSIFVLNEFFLNQILVNSRHIFGKRRFCAKIYPNLIEWNIL